MPNAEGQTVLRLPVCRFWNLSHYRYQRLKLIFQTGLMIVRILNDGALIVVSHTYYRIAYYRIAHLLNRPLVPAT